MHIRGIVFVYKAIQDLFSMFREKRCHKICKNLISERYKSKTIVLKKERNVYAKNVYAKKVYAKKMRIYNREINILSVIYLFMCVKNI